MVVSSKVDLDDQNNSKKLSTFCGVRTWIVDISRFFGCNSIDFPTDIFSVLSDEEINSSQRFKDPTHKLKSLLSNYFLRKKLSEFVGLPEIEVKITRRKHAKPHCEIDGRIVPHFSVSHSGNFLAYALAWKPVGIDIEECKAFRGLPFLVERFFTPAEATCFEEKQPNDQFRCFYGLWTKKEALIKAAEQELSLGLRTFEVLPNRGTIREWSYTTMDAPSGYAAALAGRSEIHTDGR